MQRAVTLERTQTGYDEDVAAWSQAQVALLRAGRLSDVDLANIIEEIESVGQSQRSALNSQVARILEHLLKMIYSPAIDPQRGWGETIRSARTEIEFILDSSPSLRRVVQDDFAVSLRRAKRNAVGALKDHDELGRDRERALLAQTFTPEQVLDDWFPPAR